ncbi:hypothetical protein D0962_28600 [Leptolyngbyaceae cyanobacterium CCMR0082]|uniref:Uncharacterized protein n=2 Tax=Adonisia turfae TaxID=2950184 RepID=A0A6M0SGD5_9CYAN|nr:hypothetical protein [Adonisia turfae]MDV3347252.1 hypothetical protein [Leptothoe sp. LEGE 181152]NEZ56202.1 hypothetical protein [Adonisia turfae CCMR0081]NEZ66672.1 hypothetical protein [Adonisia turfae CCMR0082]
MPYSKFTTLSQVEAAFDLTLDEHHRLFNDVKPLQPDLRLKETLQDYLPLANAVNTEKARSELIIAPILLELRRQYKGKVGFFSGTEFTVDPDAGLSGYCDYILTASADLYEVRSPVVTLVEAKNEDIKGGLGQCIAEMVAAYRFNQKQEEEISTIYGVVTTGVIWKFLRLTYPIVAIDLEEYYVKEIDKILGILSLPFLTEEESIHTA